MFRAAARRAPARRVNPEGSTLADVVAAGALRPLRRPCARATCPTTKTSEELRPALAALRLYGAALDDVGLTTDSDVGKTDRAHDAPLATPTKRTSSSRPEPRTVLDELAKITREAELTCFATILTSIETDLEG